MHSKQTTERKWRPAVREHEATVTMTMGTIELLFEEPTDPSDFDLLPVDDRVFYLSDLFPDDAAQGPGRSRLAAGEQAPRFRVLGTAELLCRPEPVWTIEGLVPESGFVVLVGRNGVGKTFLAPDIAARVSLGQSWFGKRVQPSRVLYAALEGIANRRIEAWQSHNNIDSLPDLEWTMDGVNLRNPGDQTALVGTVRDLGIRYLILDTLNRSISNFDENGSADMSLIVAFADRLRRDAACGLLVVHHTPRDGKNPRGHTSLEDAADTVISVTGRTKGTHILEVVKQRNAADGERIEFRIVTNVSTGSAVIAAHDPVQDSDQLTPNENRLVQALVQEPPILPATHGQIKERVVDQGDMPKSSFNDALRSLASKGVVGKEGSRKGALYDWTELGRTVDRKGVSHDGPT
jgi:hypothetical protein